MYDETWNHHEQLWFSVVTTHPFAIKSTLVQ